MSRKTHADGLAYYTIHDYRIPGDPAISDPIYRYSDAIECLQGLRHLRCIQLGVPYVRRSIARPPRDV